MFKLFNVNHVFCLRIKAEQTSLSMFWLHQPPIDEILEAFCQDKHSIFNQQIFFYGSASDRVPGSASG